PRIKFYNNNSPRAAFLTRFANQADKATESQTSILQALALMNGKLVADATSLDRSETLAAVVHAPFMDLNEQLETLYLATLSRKPTDRELTRLKQYVEHSPVPTLPPGEVWNLVKNGELRALLRHSASTKDHTAALADVFWALLNSGEFMLNH